MTTDTQTDNGGPAFPRPGGPQGYAQQGMSLRDYFAGQALAGWCAAAPQIEGNPINMTSAHAEKIAFACYRYADAMLDRRRRAQP